MAASLPLLKSATALGLAITAALRHRQQRITITDYRQTTASNDFFGVAAMLVTFLKHFFG
jgi:hypothetical protein